MRIDTKELFDEEKTKHLENLEKIRDFILGDINNQPQVTYVPKMGAFDRVYQEVKEWIEDSYFDDSED